MGNLLFSPNGRINPSEFTKAALILIALGFILALPEAFGMSGALTTIAGLISFLLLYPWVVIWIKRYHDAGKSGWTCLVPIIIYIIAAIILMMVLLGDEFMAMFQAASEGASQAETEAMAEEMGQGKQISLLIATTVLSAAIALGFNAIIKRDDHENQFGPAS